jgi:hypothetical protein
MYDCVGLICNRHAARGGDYRPNCCFRLANEVAGWTILIETMTRTSNSERDLERYVLSNFWHEPTAPISRDFRAFYERVKSGDLDALFEYYLESLTVANLCPAFYECIGFLLSAGCGRIPRRILRQQDRGGPLESPIIRRKNFEYWHKRLLPAARRTKSWIAKRRAQAKRQGEEIKRGRMWTEYKHEVPPALNPEAAKTFVEAIRKAPDERNLPYSGKPDLIRQDLTFWGKVPKELFMLLAATRPTVMSPSHAARKIACKIANISESSATHKVRRKK